mgnify:CR=1 FL=1
MLSPGRYLKLSVADTGTGMSPDVLKRAIDAQPDASIERSVSQLQALGWGSARA